MTAHLPGTARTRQTAVSGSVNAKNGFGGYASNQMYGCDAFVTTSGDVHAHAYPLDDVLNPDRGTS